MQQVTRLSSHPLPSQSGNRRSILPRWPWEQGASSDSDASSILMPRHRGHRAQQLRREDGRRLSSLRHSDAKPQKSRHALGLGALGGDRGQGRAWEAKTRRASVGEPRAPRPARQLQLPPDASILPAYALRPRPFTQAVSWCLRSGKGVGGVLDRRHSGYLLAVRSAAQTGASSVVPAEMRTRTLHTRSRLAPPHCQIDQIGGQTVVEAG